MNRQGPHTKRAAKKNARKTTNLKRPQGKRIQVKLDQQGCADTLCAHAGRCGACDLIHLPYEEQLAMKDRQMAELFEGLASKEAMRPILGMDDPTHFRNKVVSPFVADDKGQILTGMYKAGTHRLVSTQGCLVENPVANRVVQEIRSIMMKYKMSAYNEDTGLGFVRHAVIRVGHESGEVLVTLVTNGQEFTAAKSFCRELRRRCPQVVSVVQNVNTRQTNVILGQQERVLYGPGFILDTLCGLSFRISSQSFYQTNARQTEALYLTAVAFARLDGGQTVLDAYCGTGTIGLVAASHGAKRVIGVESVASAVHDAKLNARHNGIANATFVCADAAEWMSGLARRADCFQAAEEGLAATVFEAEGDEYGPIDPACTVLMMDPPRAGSSERFLQAASAFRPSRIVYISCNPQTQMRDCRVLAKAGYRIEALRPVDMFPHTSHVECVVSMVRERG